MFNSKYIYDEVTAVGKSFNNFDYLKVDETDPDRGEELDKFVIRLYFTESSIEFVRYGLFDIKEDAEAVAAEILETIFGSEE